MGISQKDIKLLWGRAASRCSICRIELSQDKQSTNSSFPVGEQAHIVAEQDNGPRGSSILSVEERNSYHNLVLLCPTHHEIIDKNVEDFPIEKIHILKSRHELWVQNTLAKEVSNMSKEFRPVSNLLGLVEEIKPFLFWLNRSVPPNKAKAFLLRLQQLWHSSFVIERIDSGLAYGMDNLLRPISSVHFLEKDGQNYVRGNLCYASRRFSVYFENRGFEWDNIESYLEIETILYYLERNVKKIEKNNELLDWDETNIVRLILYIVSYYKTVQREKEYIGISEGFVRQSHAVIEGFLKNELGFRLPDAFDNDENEILRELYKHYYSYDDEFDTPNNQNEAER